MSAPLAVGEFVGGAVLVVASTVMLGWHYLVDVPAGLLLGALSLYAGERTHARLAA